MILRILTELSICTEGTRFKTGRDTAGLGTDLKPIFVGRHVRMLAI